MRIDKLKNYKLHIKEYDWDNSPTAIKLQLLNYLQT